jgi:hypothetical protein
MGFCNPGVCATIRKVKGEDTAVLTIYSMLGSLVLAVPGMAYEVRNGLHEDRPGGS